MRNVITIAVLAIFAFLFALATFGAILDLNERVDPVLKLQYEKQYRDRAVK